MTSISKGILGESMWCVHCIFEDIGLSLKGYKLRSPYGIGSKIWQWRYQFVSFIVCLMLVLPEFKSKSMDGLPPKSIFRCSWSVAEYRLNIACRWQTRLKRGIKTMIPTHHTVWTVNITLISKTCSNSRSKTMIDNGPLSAMTSMYLLSFKNDASFLFWWNCYFQGYKKHFGIQRWARPQEAKKRIFFGWSHWNITYCLVSINPEKIIGQKQIERYCDEEA